MARSSRAPISFAAATATARHVAPVVDRIADSLPGNAIRPSPRNPRQNLTGIDELAASIQAHGLMQPIVVRPIANGYELVAGHRRLEAARLLGWTEIAVIVREENADEAYILTLVENLQREDLSPREEAAALEVLVRERGWSTRQIGEAVKRSAMYVSRRLRVFEDPVLAPLVLRDQLAVSTAEELLREPDVDTRRELAQQAASERWTQPVARREVAASRNVTLQPSPRLASRIRALSVELAAVDPTSLSVRVSTRPSTPTRGRTVPHGRRLSASQERPFLRDSDAVSVEPTQTSSKPPQRGPWWQFWRSVTA